MGRLNKAFRHKAFVAAVWALLLAGTREQSVAATLTWTGAAGDNNTANAANWSPAQAPINGDVLIFAGANGLAPQMNTALTTASLSFSTTAKAFTLGGTGTYTVNSGITNNSTSTETINSALRLGGNQNWKAGTGNLIINGAVNLQAFTMTDTGGKAVTINGAISGTGGITQNGKGSLTLNGNNTYSGLTTLRSGTLNIGSNTALGTGALTITGGGKLDATGGARTIGNTLQIGNNFTYLGTNALTINGASSISNNATATVNGTAALTLAGTLSGNKTLTKAGTGTLGLFGANGATFTGQIKVNAGRLLIGNIGATGTGAMTIGTATIEAAGAARTVPNALTLSGNPTFAGAYDLTFSGVPTFGGIRTLNVNNPMTTFSGAIAGGGTGIVKNGTGSLVLSGTNTFGSGTVVQDGTLILDSSTAAGALTSTITVGNSTVGSTTPATLLFSATAGRTVANPIIVPVGSTGLRTIGGLNATGVNTFSGALTLGTSVTVTEAGGGEVNFTGITSGTGGITKTGAGTVRLSNTNTFTGATLVSEGTLAYGASNALGTGTVTINGGVLDMGPNRTDIVGAVTLENGSIVGTGTSALTSTTGFTVRNGTVTSILAGTVGLTKDTSGSVTLFGANTYTGATNVNSGTLAFGASNILANTNAVTINGGILDIGTFSDTVGVVTLASGSILGTSGVLTGTSYTLQSGTVTAALGGAGVSLTKNTAGTVLVSGANSYTGATTISAGTLRLGALNSLPATTAVTMSAGTTLDLNNFNDTVGSFAGAGTISLGAGRLTTGGLNSSTAFSGAIGGTGGLTKNGTGTLTLSGVNSYTGSTDVNTGTLTLGSAASGPSASRVNLAAGATFNAAGFSATIGSLAGAGNVTLGAGTLTAGGDQTSSAFSGAISGTGGFIKSGTGTTTLTGTNTFTGSMTVNSGTVTLSGANGRAASASRVIVQTGAALNLDNTAGENLNRIGDTTPIDIQGGDLRFISDSNGSTETVGALSFLVGPANVTIVHNGAATDRTALTFSSVGSIASGIALNFAAQGGTLGADSTGPQIFFTGMATGLIGSWARVGADFAEYSVHGVRAFSDYYSGSYGINLNDPTKIVRLSATSPLSAYTLTNAGTTKDGGLSVTDLALVDLNTDATRTLNIVGGGLIKSGAPATTISGAGRLTAGGTAAASFNITVDTGSRLAIASRIIDNSGTDSIYGNVGDGSVGLVKSGTGTLALSGVNSFSGGITVNDGFVEAGADTAFGAAGNDFFINGGGLSATTGFTMGSGRRFVVTAGLAGVLDVAAGQTLSFTAASDQLATGNSASRILKSGAGDLVLGSASPNFTGTIEISAGALELRNGDALGSAAQRGTIDLNGGTLRLRSDASTSFSNPFRLLASSTIEAAPITSGTPVHSLGTVSIGGQVLTVAANSGATLALAGANLTGDATFNATAGTTTLGAISGSYGFTKTGVGVLQLNAPGTYAGSTSVNGGTLRLASATAIPLTSQVNVGASGTVNVNGLAVNFGGISGSGAIQLGAGSLTIGGNLADSTFSGVISGGGSLVKTGSETLTLGGANTYTGATNINAGIVRLAANNALPASTFVAIATGATLELATFNQTVASVTGTGTVALGAGSLNIADSVNTTFAGTITGSGSLTKAGPGTLILSGNSTTTGIITVAAGAVEILSPTGLGSGSGATSVSSGGKIRLSAGLTIASEPLNIAGSGNAGEGALEVPSGAASWNGPVALSSAATIGATGSLTVGGPISLSGNQLTVTGSGSVTSTGNISGSGSIRKTGSGTVTLSGASTFIGKVIVSAGELRILDDLALGASGVGNETEIQNGASLVLDGASDINSDESLLIIGNGSTGTGAIRVLNQVNIAAGTIRMTGDAGLDTSIDGYFAVGPVSDGGAGFDLTKNGAGLLTLTGSNTFSGSLIVTAGTVNIDGDDRFNGLSGLSLAAGAKLDLNDFSDSLGDLSGAGTITFGAIGGGTLIVGTKNTNSIFSGTIIGTGDFVKTGAGTLVVTSSNAFPDITTLRVEDGTLDIGGTTQSTGDVSVVSGAISGSTGTLLAPSYELQDGTISAKLTGSTSDLLVSGGNNFLTALNSYGGTTQIAAGTLEIAMGGGLTGTSGVVVSAGSTLVNRGVINSTISVFGTLAGTGSNTGAVTVNAGGAVSPGTDTTVGTFSTGPLSIAAGGIYRLTLDSNTDTTDRITTTGAITLGTGVAALAATDLFTQWFILGSTLTILESTTGVSGFFAGLPEGTIFTAGSNDFRISYAADSGRDVTLTVVVPEPSQGLLIACGLATLHLVRTRRSQIRR